MMSMRPGIQRRSVSAAFCIAMAGSTTMRIRRADLDAWLDALPAWHA